MTTPSTEPLVNRTIDQRVAVLEFNRPERRNALVAPMFDELADHLDALADDDSVGAVLLCGAGGAFCSGLDLDAYTADPAPDWLSTASDSLRRAHVALATCRLPIVVAMERYAINGGAAFALAGDFVVVGENSWLQVGEVRQGLPAPMNVAWLAARHSPATTLRVVLLGDRLDGAELHRLTLAHQVVPDDQVRDQAMELAAKLAECPPGAAGDLKNAVFEMAGQDDPEAWFKNAQELLPIGKGFTPGKQEE